MSDDVAPGLLAGAHVLGPLLVFFASCCLLAGWVGWEGVLGAAGAAVLVPVLISVAGRFRERFPLLAAAAQVLAAIGGPAAAVHMGLRAVFVALSRAGLITGTWSEQFLPMLLAPHNPEARLLDAAALALPLCIGLCAVGVFRSRLGPPTTAPLLGCAAVAMVLAHGVGWFPAVTGPATGVCLLAALVPLSQDYAP